MIYVKVNDTLYPAVVEGRMQDATWDGRETKQITSTMDFDAMDAVFADGCSWSIVTVDEATAVDDAGDETAEERTTEFDNREFCIRGDLTKHTDGTCTVKMGKPTDLEDAYEMIYGGI